MPPVATGVGLPWDVVVADPVATLAAARAAHGDVFVVDSGPDRYLFLFSPTALESFYALPEERASKGFADFRMLVRKLPEEIFGGRRVLPFALFRRDDVASYLANLDAALDATIAELGESGECDVFALTRRLGHRMGLASWAGPGAAHGEAFDRLVQAFDALDGADSFVHPDAMAAVQAAGKVAERAALEDVVAIVGATVEDVSDAAPLFGRIVEAWGDVSEDERRRGVALDVALIHIASMSNLASALGWLLVDLIAHEDERVGIASGDGALAEQCALESTRIAQRSIMARYVVTDVDVDIEDATLHVAAGATIATLLPLLNTSAAPGLDDWSPHRWNRHRLAEPTHLATPTQVTAFGHGKHSCPAQPFSLAAMSMTARRLFAAYELTPQWTQRPRVVSAQIGGVARPADECRLAYRAVS